jgi:hypothetical protein
MISIWDTFIDFSCLRLPHFNILPTLSRQEVIDILIGFLVLMKVGIQED